jgi:hypothetical protein
VSVAFRQKSSTRRRSFLLQLRHEINIAATLAALADFAYCSTMEKLLKIPLSADLKLYGKFSGSFDHPLFMVVHGLPCSMEEAIYQGATKWFGKKGYATFRFNLYDWHKDARQLIDSTLSTHADDIDTIVRYFKKRGTKKVFVAGHSFGGPSVLLSREKQFDAVVLWDPSYELSFTKSVYGVPGGRYVKELDGYLMHWGSNPIIGKSMAQEADALDWKHLTKDLERPLRIITAEKGVLMRSARQYYKTACDPKDLAVIEGATHYFDDVEGMQRKLYALTEQWFRNFK